MAEPYYCTASELKAHPDVPDSMTDPDLILLIEDVEDIIDQELGDYDPDTTTGRKIVQAEVEAWQWTKLKRATIKLGARLYLNPRLRSGVQWRSQSGPDFAFSGPVGSRLGEDVAALLDQSQLRRLTTTVGAKRSRPPWWPFAYNVDRDDPR